MPRIVSPLLMVGFATLLSACWEPDSKGPATSGSKSATTMGGEGGAPTQIDLAKIVPQLPQEQVALGEFVTVSGQISGDECKGIVRVDVIEVGPSADGPGTRPPGPLTIIPVATVGPFTGKIPKGRTVSLSALCDRDGDGTIQPPEDRLAIGTPLGEVTADVTGVALVLGQFPGPSSVGGEPGGPGVPGADGAPPSSEMPGGPPPGGQAGDKGPPPQGGSPSGPPRGAPGGPPPGNPSGDKVPPPSGGAPAGPPPGK